MGAGGAALVLLPLLISGYLFNLIFYPVRYFNNRAEGQKLFFMAAGSGLIIATLVFATTGAIRSLPGFEASLLHQTAVAIDTAIPIPYACRLVLTVGTSIVGGGLLNLSLAIWLRCFSKEHKASKRSAAKHVYGWLTGKFGHPLTQLFRRAAGKQKYVMLTLKSRKIYCGRIMEAPSDPEDDSAYIELFPFFSGYRDKDTLRLGREKTNYPAFVLWEAEQLLYSRKSLKDIFVQEYESKGFSIQQPKIAAQSAAYDAQIRAAEEELANYQEKAKTRLDPLDWIKVIPYEEIESASFYDPSEYKEWFARTTDARETAAGAESAAASPASTSGPMLLTVLLLPSALEPSQQQQDG